MNRRNLERMVGIYMITNKTNGKKYIGQSNNIFIRWRQHYYASIENKECDKSVLHKAIRANGIENFEFSILELCEVEELNKKEKFYIGLYDTSIYAGGYNITEGGNSPNQHGERNPASKLTENDVYNIREAYKNKTTKRDAYKLVCDKISINTFSDVWNGKTWKRIHMDVYTEENKKFQSQNFDRMKNHSRVVTNEEVLKIRDLYNEGNLAKSEIYEMFSNLNINTFNDIWYNNTFKHIQSSKPNNRNSVIVIAKDQRGYKNIAAKFTKEEILAIRKRRDNGETMNEVYQDYKQRCLKQTFRNVWKNKTYTNVK